MEDILIDITMTACQRPEILKETLNSFFRNLLAPVQDRCRLIINIDPIGEDFSAYKIADIASAYFTRNFICLPSTPSFPRAFKWCWDKVEAPWVLHLEDDWGLLAPVDITAMIAMMEKHRDLASLRLPKFSADCAFMKNWNLFFPWNGEFFECPDGYRRAAGFAGHPSLLRGEFVKKCAPLINETLNPEKQFHGDNDPLVMEVLNWRYGVWGQPNSNPLIKDLGEKWRVNNNFKKAGGINKAFFTQWEKI